MIRRAACLLWLFCPLLFGCVCACALSQAASAPLLQVPALGAATAPLTDPWQFHPGDDPAWASPTLDDSRWERISTGRCLGTQGYFAFSGFAWYRRHVSVVPSASPPNDLWIYLPHVDDVAEVYWNGRPMGRVGRFPPHGSHGVFQWPRAIALGPDHTGVLALRIWKAPLLSWSTGEDGGLCAAPVLGSKRGVESLVTAGEYASLRSSRVARDLSLVYLFVCLSGLGVWLQRRDQALPLWLALFALANLHQVYLMRFVAGVSELAWGLLTTLVYQPLLDFSTWFILLHLLDFRRDPRVMRWVRVLIAVELSLCVIDAICYIFWSPGWPQVLDLVVSEIILLPELFPVVLVAMAVLSRRRLTLVTWLVAALALLTDLLAELGAFFAQGVRFTHWTLWKVFTTPVVTVAGYGLVLQELSSLVFLLVLVVAVYRHSVLTIRREQVRQRELRSAQELQRVLIPEELPTLPGYEITSAYQPALEVGGDFFQVLSQADGTALLVLGDVSGKGLPAAMTVSLIVGALRTLAEFVQSPAEILAGINRRLLGKLGGGFATCVVVRLQINGELTIASAGHPPPLLTDHEIDLAPALPLGLDPDATFAETVERLDVGQRLTLFSDGLLEARNHAGELFGFARTRQIAALAANAGAMADAAVAFGQDDDISVVTITRLRIG